MSPTERERCPTCDQPEDEHPLKWNGPQCPGPRVDWRARALAAEAQLAGGDVRPFAARVTALAQWYWADREQLHRPGRRAEDWIRYTTAGDRIALRRWAGRCLLWLDAHERTEGRAETPRTK